MLKTSKRVLAFILMLAMTVSMFIPMMAFAATGSVSDYASFMEDLEVLEQYATGYAASNSGKSVQELMINFIRTGVDRYNDGNWKTLAGEEIVGFTSYVEAQDAATGNSVMDLRDIIVDDFKLPNGNQVDFGHMFGTLNIAYVASQASADLGGWAGDLCDLVYFSKMYGNVPTGTIEEMADYVLKYCFGVDADDAFGMDDFYGDLDAFYIHTQIKAGASLYETVENYFTAELDDVARSAYFLNNRFKGFGLETREDVREAIHDTYASNVGLQVLEADRGISDETDLRRACCYAFADYLFNNAGHLLDTGFGGEGGETPDEPTDPDEPAMDNDYYSIFSSTASTLAPGITQTINYAQTVDKKQIVYYVATVDVNRDDVTIMANYRDNDPGKGWGMQRVEDQAKALVAKHSNPADTANYIENFNAIVATNGDGYNMSTGQPGGLLVMEGVEYHPVDKDGFFAILKDGSAMIGTQADYATYKDKIQEGIGGFGAVLVKDGEIVTSKLGSYYSTRASRTAIGITADGKVVMMVLDGRQEPFSAGGAMEEIAQIMLDAGCVDAINLDGGGSTTYLSKPEGEDALKLINRPSDGYARSVSTSLVAVSTAKSSKEFDHANISSDYEYLTIGTSLTLTAAGVSNTGNAAPIPEDAIWTVSDANIGYVTADGVFTATANGEVEVQLVSGGNVIGSITLHVVVPDAIAFENETITAIYGVPTELSILLSYSGNPVAYNASDLWVLLENETAGIISGRTFVGNEESGIRTVMVGALLLANQELMAFANISLYKADEAFFDFDNATSGNRQFAWFREVSNAETKDSILYQIVDANDDMQIDYTFAIDMTQIAIPDQLADLTSMLPGSDVNSTAWAFLLQLAERVSVLTEVKITAQFDSDLDVDISGMTVSNEYFKLQSAILDENNKLTLVCKWVDQTAAIDPKTANPICLLSGIKLTPKSGAWDANNRITVVNTGDVSYNIYLRASALYSFASSPANQEKYGLRPYSASDTGYEGGTEKGASFGSTYVTFRDEYILDKTNRNGWYNDDSLLYYYVNNELLPAGVYELPSYEDPTVKFWYEIDESGASLGKYTGKFENNGKLMYAMGGEIRKGWQSILESNGESYFYYFDPYTYDAVGDGEGWIKVEGYNYYFVDNKCMKGSIVKTSKGYQYRFAGLWQRDQWVEFEGNWYYIEHNYVALANGFQWARTIDGQGKECHLFDENGVWMQDYNGIYDIGNDSYYIVNGVRIQEAGVVYIDGYYYYFASNAKAVKNRTYWPTKTNGLIPVAAYNFDEYGRITNPPVVKPPVEPDEPETPVDPPVEPDLPDEPDTPDEPEVKNGLVSENGGIFYYKNGKLQYAAGLIEVDGYYYYIRSNGQAAVGNYWITNTNGLMEQGIYTFGTDGKMVVEEEPDEPEIPDEPEVPEVKNGVYAEDGVLYYYKDGKRDYGAGVLKLADDTGREYYIYVRSNGQLATGVYWPTTTNGLLKTGAYHWGTDGRYYPPITPGVPDEPETPDEPEVPEVKNGIYEEGGVLYYYKDGKRAYGAGVVKLTDDEGREFYIYVRSNAQLATGTYWPTTTNGLLATAKYDWGTDGRLYL